MKSCGIYKITNIVNGKVVIGQAINITARWQRHKGLLRHNKHYNSHFQNAWNKYGEQNFKFEIILECLREKLNEEEIRLIKEHKSNNRKYGYNIEEGGNIRIHSEETRRKISEANKNPSEETRRKMSEAHKGYKHSEETKRKLSIISSNPSEETKRKLSESHRGKVCTKETKRKISKANSNPSEETREKMANARRGKHPSIETRRKLSEVHSGKRNNNYGKHFSEAHKRKMSEAHKLFWKKKRNQLHASSASFIAYSNP
jgi:group I intron endonuclease